jgi:glycosyltransferase involved in cell wall biosynthesis
VPGNFDVRLLYLVSHPIQYQAPLLRRIAAEAGIELLVLFENLETAGAYFDEGFGAEVTWDVPVTEGYQFQYVGSLREIEERISEADVMWIHGWDSRLKLRALEVARRRGVPVLMRGENTLTAMPDGRGLRGLLKRTYLRWIFYRCAAFLCIGTDNRNYYRAHGIDDARLFSMPYAVDNEFFTQQANRAMETREDFRRELGLSPSRPVILFAGKFQRRKNAAVLAAAFQSLDRGATRDPYLLFVGDGEQRKLLEAVAATDGAVRVVGFRNQRELPAFYDLADVFVLPSSNEPWGLAVNEAMASGCAIIATNECGCAADLIDGRCGRVVSADDPQVLASALSEILCDESMARDMGAKARERVSEFGFDEDLAGLSEAMKAVVSVPPQA